jgi:hypothetical protein
LKRGAGEEWRSIGPTVGEIKRYCTEPGRKQMFKYNEKKKAKWIGHILRRNSLLKHMTEGQIEGRRCKQILDDIK